MSDSGSRGIFQDLQIRGARDLARALTVSSLAVILFRLSQRAGTLHPLLGHLTKQINHVITGADLAWQATAGPGLRLFHPTGVVIGPFVTMGSECSLQQGVTLGGMGGETRRSDDSPTVGSRVAIGSGAKIFGAVTIGDDARIGANAVVLQSIPAGATAIGVPARVAEPRWTGNQGG
jgi:serine O-acetyltransferase